MALQRPLEAEGYRFSYDMLGEAAFTAEDAKKYFASYKSALTKLGAKAVGADVFSRPSISVKFSALHPRYEVKQQARVRTELLPQIIDLAVLAKSLNVGLTVDAEEVNRLDLSLDLFENLAVEPRLKDWNGLGLAVQAYGKRAKPVLDWLVNLAKANQRVLPVRLVKGAYWDTEIKRAQEAGFEAYPLFTRKVSTDVSYLACAKFMLGNRNFFFPQFATHNAHSIAAIKVMAGEQGGYEFQRLHGMGQALYEQVVGPTKMNLPCRIYAPVGSHEDLLAYLVRRLLENGANTSFVNRLADDDAPIADIIADPAMEVGALAQIPHPRIPPPRNIFEERVGSAGAPLWDDSTRAKIVDGIKLELVKPVEASALVDGKAQRGGPMRNINAPHDNRVNVGLVHETDEKAVTQAMSSASKHQHDWDLLGGEARAAILEKAASLYEKKSSRLLALLVQEAGKTLDNALSDLREAVDFLRYYAVQARAEFSEALRLPGPTGESNELTLHGRGVFACIAPWNFPLAIFTGQVAAALAGGNAVVAKPAEQTPLVAHEAVKLSASRRSSSFNPAFPAGRWRAHWKDPSFSSCPFRGCLYRFQRNGVDHQPGACGARRCLCFAHRRNRRHECDDR